MDFEIKSILQNLTFPQRRMVVGAFRAHHFTRNYGGGNGEKTFLSHWANQQSEDREDLAVSAGHAERVCNALADKGVFSASYRGYSFSKAFSFTERGLKLAQEMRGTLPVRERLAWEQALRDEFDRQNRLFLVERQITSVRYERTVVAAKNAEQAIDKHTRHMAGQGAGGVKGVCCVKAPETESISGSPSTSLVDCDVSPVEVYAKTRDIKEQLEFLFGEKR